MGNKLGLQDQNKESPIKLLSKYSKESFNEIENLKFIKQGNHCPEDIKLLHSYIHNHFYLNTLEATEREEVIKITSIYISDPKTQIMKQDFYGEYLFIIKEGVFEKFCNNKLIKTISEGSFLGDKELLSNSPRSYSIYSKSKGILFAIDKNHFISISEQINKINFDEAKFFINQSKYFINLEKDRKLELANYFCRHSYEIGKTIFSEEEYSFDLYFIKEGEIEVKNKEKIVRVVKANDFFGEFGVIYNIKRTKTVVSKSRSVIFSINKINLCNVIKSNKLKEIIVSIMVKNILINNETFKNFSNTALEIATNRFNTKYYRKNEVVLGEKYPIGARVAMVLQGKLIDVN